MGSELDSLASEWAAYKRAYQVALRRARQEATTAAREEVADKLLPIRKKARELYAAGWVTKRDIRVALGIHNNQKPWSLLWGNEEENE